MSPPQETTHDREVFCAKPDVNDLLDGLCGCDRGAYDDLTTEGKAGAMEDFMDCVLGVLDYPKTGLSLKPQIALAPPYDLRPESVRNAGLPENLRSGRYVATSSFGWTEFNIDAVTQKLRVTTYGVDPYPLPSNDESYSAEEAEAFVDRVPRVMSQFEVEPRCGCQQLACVGDDACGNGWICDLIGCVLKNSVPNGELCADADACARCSAGRCAPCVNPGAACARDGACCSNSCGLGIPPRCD